MALPDSTPALPDNVALIPDSRDPASDEDDQSEEAAAVELPADERMAQSLTTEETALGAAGPDEPLAAIVKSNSAGAATKAASVPALPALGAETRAALDSAQAALRAAGEQSTGGPASLAWGARVSPAFRAEVLAICGMLGCNPNDLMAAIAFESAETFSPSVRNPYSGATGLIQFMPTTAAKLGTSTDELAQMSAEEQLLYVEAYFIPFRGHLNTLADLYMAILWPRAIGQTEDTVLFGDQSVQYTQNSFLDLDGDGAVTKLEATARVTAKLARGLQAGFVAASR
ncbi:MAG: hypothetical protein QOF51_2895 [Chloroflexota bacterium]|jgi:hypothetical protein|nr:hypothetical protein [Chloroflexota bacterium]